MRSIKFVTGVVVIVAVAAGCTSKQSGTAISPAGNPSSAKTGTSPEPTSSSSAANAYGAPRVSTPLDATRFLPQPCAVLTSAQLQSLNLPVQGKPDTDSQIAKTVGPGCVWLGKETPSTGIGVGFLAGNKNGLSDIYRGHQQGDFKGYFEPTTVDGYPAVFLDVTDFRPDGTCDITVGISDTLAFHAAENGTKFKGQASCDRAKQAASFMIQTMKSGG